MAIPGLGVSCVWKRRAHFIAHAHSIPLCAQHEKQNQKQHTKHAIIVAIPILCCTTSVKQGSVRTGSTVSRFPPTHGSAANGEWWLMALVTARDIRLSGKPSTHSQSELPSPQGRCVRAQRPRGLQIPHEPPTYAFHTWGNWHSWSWT